MLTLLRRLFHRNRLEEVTPMQRILWLAINTDASSRARHE